MSGAIGTLTPLPAGAATANGPILLHATAVAHAGKGLLILGPSGAGKSSLALRMLALGARLISDDQTEVFAAGEGLGLRCPSPAIRGLIEARGLGLLRVQPQDVAVLSLVIDMGCETAERLPNPNQITICHTKLPLVLRTRNGHLAEALLLWLEQP